ncbi:MAG: efflux RND transporter permease subunit [Calditrichaeota bacterium]|nr:MAG: AcrB/AcrD/AcrF family protein [Calditrichota bacterium]MBL1204350.1 efflux RND transporter permease subunit [Calditrichota bacterium]NOG44179.1 efflux RND transporter permease subunit [Calditrichota bacterium]
MKITNISLKYKTSVFVLLAILIFSGLVSYNNLAVESFPSIEQPFVIVAVPYTGVSPEDMETLVANPLEKKIKEITKIKKISSASLEGYTNITIEFESDIEVDDAVRKVREKVDQARPDLPDDIEEPVVQEVNMENFPIMLVSIVGNQSLVRLKKIAEDLQDKFEQITGVLEVNISGGLEREVKVNLNARRLEYYNLGTKDVTDAIRNENITTPGGSIDGGGLKYTVRIPGEFDTVDELQTIVVKHVNGQPVYLRDLADVKFGFKEQTSYSRLNNQPSVTISILKRSGENIINIATEVKAILEEDSKNFPAQTHYVISNDQSKDIKVMVNDLENNIISGLLLVVLVLYFFMGTRNGVLVGIAIPISMVISFIVIEAIGFTLNMMVLFSLILALGMLVDNAIVIVENIYRHHLEGKSLMQAAKDGTAEVGMAVVTSTITTLGAFAPLVFWSGFIGEFMSFLPITLIITLSSSLLVGLVFNPTLSSSFLRIERNLENLPGDKFLRWLTPLYEKTLDWALHNRVSRALVMLMAGGGFIFMLVIFVMFNHGIEFFPDLEPRAAWIKVDMPIGSRLQSSNNVVKEIEKRIVDTPDMKYYIADVGNQTDPNDMSGQSAGTLHKSQVTVELHDKHLRSQNSFITLKVVADKLKDIPGAQIDVTKPPDGPPTGAAVEIQLKGEDFDILDNISADIQELIRDVDGLVKLKDNYEKGKPEITIRIDREKASLFGLNTFEIANVIRTAVNGTEASKFRVGKDEYDITVRFDKDFRASYSDILNLSIFYEGKHYPLANFATVELGSGLTRVNHVDRDRVITINGDAFGRSSSEILREVKEKLADFEMPVGYTFSFAGQDEQEQESMDFLANAFMIALFLIFFVLVSQFNSLILPVVIMASVFLSFFGIFFGLLVTGYPFGIIMTGIGIISLAGVVVNNAIVLIDYIQKLRARGMAKTAAIIQAGKTRLRPVLLTAITTILGLLPLTIGLNIDFIGMLKFDFHNVIEWGAESSQWWANMGVAVIFGLLFATALTLVIVPVMYHLLTGMADWASNLFGKKEKKLAA